MQNKINKLWPGLPVILLSVGFIYLSSAYAEDGSKERKILYYRNPMNPSITSKVPAKDHMGMDYIPVYEQEEASMQSAPAGAENIVRLSEREAALAGVVSEPAMVRHLFKEIRTVGTVAYDPQLYKAEEEYIQALKAEDAIRDSGIQETKASIHSLVEAARLKLQLLGLSDELIDELAKEKRPDRSLIISDNRSPYVWVYADIYESELSWVKVNQQALVTSLSFPGEEFKGRILAIDPILNPMTRSQRLRIKIDNPALKLKPQMYVDIFIEAYLADEHNQHKMALAIPADALLDTGLRKIVYVDLGKGAYLGKEIKTGPLASAYVGGQKRNFYPVISGLKENEKVVTKANFLLDSESQISGVAASAYGGALGAKEEAASADHRH